MAKALCARKSGLALAVEDRRFEANPALDRATANGHRDVMTQNTDWQGSISRARAHAPFLARLLDREPALAALLAEGKGEEALAMARLAGAGLDDVPLALRRERRALALALAIGDLAGGIVGHVGYFAGVGVVKDKIAAAVEADIDVGV